MRSQLNHQGAIKPVKGKMVIQMRSQMTKKLGREKKKRGQKRICTLLMK